ncbi:MAG: cobalt transporter [Alphaproteobacteria bacterium]|nr:cobalt transporter [Alphaproteobacteria bacterium]
MILRALLIAVIAGAVAGLAVTLLQSYKLTPLIHEAETFEHAASTSPAGDTHGAEPAAGVAAEHDHGDGAWAPADGIERVGFTSLANILTGIGFALLLVAGFILSGRPVRASNGLLWGMAGFAAFVLAPALQMPPELPGAAAIDVSLRQMAWLGIAVATAGGIALIAFGARPWLKAVGVAAIVLPQLLSLPLGDGIGLAPPELAAEFAILSVAGGAIFWAVLGSVAGYLYGRVQA